MFYRSRLTDLLMGIQQAITLFCKVQTLTFQ